MKKATITVLLIFATFLLKAQSLELHYDGDLLDNTSVLSISGDPNNALITFYGIEVKNVLSDNIEVHCYREVIQEVTGSENRFCWATCYDPIIDSSLYSVTINGNASTFGFYCDYLPHGYSGVTKVMYTFYNAANPNDNVKVTVEFDASVQTSVAEQSFDYAFSDAYPNPANEEVQFDFELDQNNVNAELVIYDLLGTMIKRYRFEELSGTKSINTNSFSEGIYFYSFLINNESVKTQKLIITH